MTKAKAKGYTQAQQTQIMAALEKVRRLLNDVLAYDSFVWLLNDVLAYDSFVWYKLSEGLYRRVDSALNYLNQEDAALRKMLKESAQFFETYRIDQLNAVFTTKVTNAVKRVIEANRKIPVLP